MFNPMFLRRFYCGTTCEKVVGKPFFFFVVLIILSIIIYSPYLHDLFTFVLQRQDSSHGIFVPFISAYFLWVKFDKIKDLKPVPSRLAGSLFLFAGILLFYLGNFTSFSLSLPILSFLFIVAAFVLFLLGRNVFLETAFPLFFLATMIPLPLYVYNQIANWMRQINTFVAVSVTKAFGVPLYREEFTLYLPGVNLFVSDDCSGIRYLLSYFTFSLVYVFLFKQGLVARLLLVLCSVPLAVLAGITRLSLIFLAAHYISPAMAGHRPHIILSWVIFVFWLVVPVSIDHYLSRRRVQKNTKKSPVFC